MVNPFNSKAKKPEKQDLFVLLIFLYQYFGRIELQRKRIENNLKPSKLSRVEELFSDIHFYFNTVSNIQKILLKIRQINSTDEVFMGVYKKYLRPIQNIDSIRDHLEHITDNRFKGMDRKGNSFKEPLMLGNLRGDVYNFCGEKINLKEMFKMISGLEAELLDWDKDGPLRERG